MSWYQLDSTLKEQAEYAQFYRAAAPLACPNDGEPLTPAPGTESGSGMELFCRFDGWQYPRDYNPDMHSGM